MAKKPTVNEAGEKTLRRRYPERYPETVTVPEAVTVELTPEQLEWLLRAAKNQVTALDTTLAGFTKLSGKQQDARRPEFERLLTALELGEKVVFSLLGVK